MSDIAIRVENLSKSYFIAHSQPRLPYRTLQEELLTLPRRLWCSARGYREVSELFWALENVSIEVKQGEVLGIVGRNGAGKSTLLKILSRITEPTRGRAEIYGRVGALLEVGTGFHPELTGRENIFLSGAILGMQRNEILHRFDEIVEFAGVQQFIDTPAKHYSSGMYMRLAFAVAAHLEPEILVVDEVLAVGDWDFQKKCLSKMGDISREGRTVLLVSHNMPAVLNFCPRAILLDSGEVILDDKASTVIQQYTASLREAAGEVVWKDREKAPGDENVRLYAVRILSEGGESTADLDIAKEIQIQIIFWNLHPNGKLYPAIHLKDQSGAFVLTSPNLPSASLTVDPWSGKPLPIGLFQSTCRIPGNLLNEGTYVLDAIVNERIGFHGGAYALDVMAFHVFDSGAMRKEHLRGWPGVVRPRLAWHTEYLGDKE